MSLARGARPRGPGGVAAVIAIEDERWNAVLPDATGLVETALAAIARELRPPVPVSTELGVTLADDAAVEALNAEWRGKNKPTNVLSFPMLQLAPGETPGPMLGDLVLALETLQREADAEEKPLADHFCHLVVHGTLHCFGYDHETQADAEAMEALEVRILATLGVPDPYREFDLQEEPVGA